ncbi:WxL domain-containing protein [Apilactobacillus micheneri]|uniref:WxL domain-containing protein n=1 Tax=Apilactobacillus micheneri TaxID=1899430 RepID=A0ABY2Z447_9LACO|nr:WxL domain-containing protein [Apilactobacillus micheneri]TPR26487.1 WxL domain-containing protein [Apilactobacillus micheneri]TPR27241.1 WxL domain-containing protein [Apilactobacillus micheneri]TPR27488.1 WxL domain-containing protein [Apilactobacillus micheneri]TPR32004.1 WxL domain-containing protein [Apilactobacillus micheneri]TPR32408.1 WxL domain-containing protein [Apilactobacillus micheneri]
MKKLLLCTAALTMFAGSALALNGSNVKADDANTSSNSENKDQNNNGMSTDGNSVKTFTYFKVDNSSTNTPPVNPDNTDNKLNNPEFYNIFPTNATGDLTIDAVPKSLNFGETDKNLEGKDINVTLNDNKDNNKDNNIERYYAQVSDYRGNHTGWHLSANMSEMTDKNNPLNKLDGANIKFSNNKVLGAYGNNANQLGDPNNVKTDNINLDPSRGNVTVMSAADKSGAGTWFDLFNNINLSAGRADSGNYNGTITWNLSDGPSTPNNTTGTNGNN